MSHSNAVELSVVVPVFNEAANLPDFHAALQATLISVVGEKYEIIYCDDGSVDASAAIIRELRASDSHVKLLKLSRNFGKENALTAGIAAATGQAVLMIDSDGQHPVEKIPDFLDAWRKGARVVIGLRQSDGHDSALKRWQSKAFYIIFNSLAGQSLLAGSTDYRLIDRSVQQEFLKLTETERITRGLIDWLGFSPVYIEFQTNPRMHGEPGYSRQKLFKLAINSVVSLSPKPLYLFGYLGLLISFGAFLLGLAVFIEQLLFGDPLHWNFTGTAMLGILVLFLVGIVLVAQGLLSLYVSHIHSQSKGRPLYVIDHKESAGLDG
jgi:dolichol-phosphate mannosyltransferase